MGMQHHLRADSGEVIEGAHRHIDLIPHALHIDQYQRRKFFQQLATNSAYHTNRPRFMR